MTTKKVTHVMFVEQNVAGAASKPYIVTVLMRTTDGYFKTPNGGFAKSIELAHYVDKEKILPKFPDLGLFHVDHCLVEIDRGLFSYSLKHQPSGMWVMKSGRFRRWGDPKIQFKGWPWSRSFALREFATKHKFFLVTSRNFIEKLGHWQGRGEVDVVIAAVGRITGHSITSVPEVLNIGTSSFVDGDVNMYRIQAGSSKLSVCINPVKKTGWVNVDGNTVGSFRSMGLLGVRYELH